MDTLKLVKAAKKGDTAAFEMLLHQEKAKLYRIALSYLKNEQDALEAIQETTFRALKHIKKLRNPAYFSTWITRIMMNYCMDECRRQQRISADDSSLQEIGEKEEKDLRLQMEEAVQQLEPKLQEIIILKYFQDLTIEQIAAAVNRPTGTIKTWLHQALKQLRQALAKEGNDHV